MAKERKIKFVRSNSITKAAIVAAVVLSMIALLALYTAIDRLNDQNQALADSAMELESDNSQLEEDISILGTLESALRIAMEKLGLIAPDSVVISPDE